VFGGKGAVLLQGSSGCLCFVFLKSCSFSLGPLGSSPEGLSMVLGWELSGLLLAWEEEPGKPLPEGTRKFQQFF